MYAQGVRTIIVGDFYTEKLDEAPALDITVPSEDEKVVNRILTEKN